LPAKITWPRAAILSTALRDADRLRLLGLRRIADRTAAEQPGRPLGQLVAPVLEQLLRLLQPVSGVDGAAQDQRLGVLEVARRGGLDHGSVVAGVRELARDRVADLTRRPVLARDHDPDDHDPSVSRRCRRC
jgi:hypothetical protein